MIKNKVFILILFCLIALAACTEEKWKESSLFYSGSYQMIGTEKKLGFIYDDTKATRFYPGKENKYMWHVWGEDVAGKNLRVTATKEGSTEEIPLVGAVLSSTPHNGADASVPSGFSLPEAGMWKLDAYIDEKLHDSIFVKVHENLKD